MPDPEPHTRRARPNLLATDLVWIVLGLATSVLTAYVLALVNLRLHLAIFAFMGFGILPIGALSCGVVASSGYTLAARLTKRVPGPVALACMMVSGLLTFVLIYWFEYRRLEVGGKSVSALIPFGEFLRAVIGSATMRITPIDLPIALGKAGYALAALQAFAFWFSALGPYFLNASRLHCDRCGRFLPELSSTFGYGSPEELAGAFVTTRGLASGGALSSAQAHVAALPQQELNHKLDLETADCKRCDRAYYRLRLLGWTIEQTWHPVPGHDVCEHVAVRKMPSA